MRQKLFGLLSIIASVWLFGCSGESSQAGTKIVKSKPEPTKIVKQTSEPVKRKSNPKTEVLAYAKKIVNGSAHDKVFTKKLLTGLLKYSSSERQLLYRALLRLQVDQDKPMSELIGSYHVQFAERFTGEFILMVDEMSKKEVQKTGELIGFEKMLEDGDDLKNTKAFVSRLSAYKDEMVNPSVLDSLCQTILNAAVLNYE